VLQPRTHQAHLSVAHAGLDCYKVQRRVAHQTVGVARPYPGLNAVHNACQHIPCSDFHLPVGTTHAQVAVLKQAPRSRIPPIQNTTLRQPSISSYEPPTAPWTLDRWASTTWGTRSWVEQRCQLLTRLTAPASPCMLLPGLLLTQRQGVEDWLQGR
jgi:hypothetical protein